MGFPMTSSMFHVHYSRKSVICLLPSASRLYVLVCSFFYSPPSYALLVMFLCQHMHVYCAFSSSERASHRMDTALVCLGDLSYSEWMWSQGFLRMGCPFPQSCSLPSTDQRWGGDVVSQRTRCSFWVQLSGASSVIQVKQRQVPSLPCKGLAAPSHRPRPRAAKSSSSFLFPTSGKASLFIVIEINSPKGHTSWQVQETSGTQARWNLKVPGLSRNLPACLISPPFLPSLPPRPSLSVLQQTLITPHMYQALW